MSMSTHVVGFRPPDNLWNKHKVVWDACKNANVPIPKETIKFFNDAPPNIRGVEVYIPCRKWQGGDCASGIEINVDDIPSNIKMIRFFNSW